MSSNNLTQSSNGLDSSESSSLCEVYDKVETKASRFKNYCVPYPDMDPKYKLVTRPNSISKVWNYFHVFQSCEPGKCPPEFVGTHGCWAVCNDCGKVLTYHSVSKDGIETSTTSSVNMHLKLIHKITKKDIEMGIGSSESRLVDGSITSCFDRSTDNKWISTEHKNATIKQLTTEWICEELLPF